MYLVNLTAICARQEVYVVLLFVILVISCLFHKTRHWKTCTFLTHETLKWRETVRLCPSSLPPLSHLSAMVKHRVIYDDDDENPVPAPSVKKSRRRGGVDKPTGMLSISSMSFTDAGSR